jgi:hypothetical protein
MTTDLHNWAKDVNSGTLWGRSKLSISCHESAYTGRLKTSRAFL